MFAITIKGKFTTGTTRDDEEQAKESAKQLLIERLKQASCYGASQLFQFTFESVEAEKL